MDHGLLGGDGKGYMDDLGSGRPASSHVQAKGGCDEEDEACGEEQPLTIRASIFNAIEWRRAHADWSLMWGHSLAEVI